MKVGTSLTDKDLKKLSNNRGRVKLINQNDWWFDYMRKDKGKWVVLEVHNSTATVSSRLRNRVTNLNKQLKEENRDYRFSTKTTDNSIMFLGRYR